ncbi:hypothetical protein FVEN_g317 [Fusarium venenatum]|uniref:Uncharacterized protein n=1 Tax=Fusarium venenatum TaxID=56646 RepID=A0A2L2TFE9_9HYPO|nr:uncharacterized protein FVRRES_07573 [Fusarium venenatum]KAG8362415.1 hypothetical protein FVEN_g317 [Fusarium venenatum]CEI63137.1 unnamed protein product [Fusarium venenatum]
MAAKITSIAEGWEWPEDGSMAIDEPALELPVPVEEPLVSFVPWRELQKQQDDKLKKMEEMGREPLTRDILVQEALAKEAWDQDVWGEETWVQGACDEEVWPGEDSDEEIWDQEVMDVEVL